MIQRSLFLLGIALTLAVSAAAEPYWISYEGNDYPENVGWERVWGNWDGPYQGDGAVRTLEDGVLTLDTLYDDGVVDFYQIERPGAIDPEPGELFVMEWRLNVEGTLNGLDPGVGVASNDAWIVAFDYYEDHIVSSHEPGNSVTFAPGIFHEYHLESLDMRTYTLYIDGAHAFDGEFWNGLLVGSVGWGNTVQGASSRSMWDYFRFGVVPEPTSGVLLVLLSLRVLRNRP